ncbi:hypothetical protein NL676_005507 [Syzygium grande]|nr:hypothetical protein NL676_005507 [Syzygium grande]
MYPRQQPRTCGFEPMRRSGQNQEAFGPPEVKPEQSEVNASFAAAAALPNSASAAAAAEGNPKSPATFIPLTGRPSSLIAAGSVSGLDSWFSRGVFALLFTWLLQLTCRLMISLRTGETVTDLEDEVGLVVAVELGQLAGGVMDFLAMCATSRCKIRFTSSLWAFAKELPSLNFRTGAPSTRRTRNFPWQTALFEDSIRAAGIQGIEIGTKLYVSNLDYGVTNEDIRELFSEIGDVKRYAVHYDKNGRSSGSAEVVYTRRSDAFAALKRYNNVLLDGKPMKIEIVGANADIPVSARVNVTGVNGRRKRTVTMTPGRGGARGPPVVNRGTGRGRRGGFGNRKICCAINGADELTVHGLRKTLRGNQSHVRGNNAALGRDADMKAFPVIARLGWKLQRLPLFCPLPPYFCVVFP